MAGAAVTTGRPASWLVAAGALILLAGAVFFGGGSGHGSVPLLGGLAVACACTLVAVSARGGLALPRPDRAGWIAAIGLVALVAWVGLSALWSIAGDRSWDALAKGLVYLAFALIGLAVAGAGLRPLHLLASGLAAVLGVALVWALAGVAVPALFPGGDRIARLREPVGYWNALALLADAALVLGLWLGTCAMRRLERVGGALLLYVATLALLLTQSRAGVAAGVLVVGLWLGLARERAAAGLVLVVGAVPAALVAGWAFTRPALAEDGALRADRVADGAVFAVLAIAGALVVVACFLAVPIDRLARSHGRTVIRWLLGAAAVVVVCAGLLLGARVGNPGTWAGDQFTRGECVNDPGRLTDLCANNRVEWWREAVDVWRVDPATGAGAGTFELARKRHRDNAANVTQPHSVPLQLLAGVGLVGLVLALVLAAAVAAGLVRTLRRLDGGERAAAAALVALPAAWAVHALVDYPLDFLAVTAPTMLVTFALLGAGRPRASLPGGWPAVAASAALGLAVLAVLVTPRLAERDVERSEELLVAGRLDAAADAAERARTFGPLGIAPVLAAGRVEEQRGDLTLAAALFEEAVDLQPENPEAWFELGLFELYTRDDPCAAYVALNEAYTRDPNGKQWTPGGALDVARDAVNDGACEP